MSVPATLRGYRTQYLYTLYRILNEDDPRTFFRPEGKEDLDIKFGNGYTELVQVKNLSKTLTFSDLQSKGKTRGSGGRVRGTGTLTHTSYNY